MTRKLNVTLFYGSDAIWTGTLLTFWRDNADISFGEMRDAVRSLQQTGEARFGGGAAPAFTLRAA